MLDLHPTIDSNMAAIDVAEMAYREGYNYAMNKPKDNPISEKCEQYLVSLNYPKPDGKWVLDHSEYVDVYLKDDMERFFNHEKAEEIAKLRFPGCVVTRACRV